MHGQHNIKHVHNIAAKFEQRTLAKALKHNTWKHRGPIFESKHILCLSFHHLLLFAYRLAPQRYSKVTTVLKENRNFIYSTFLGLPLFYSIILQAFV